LSVATFKAIELDIVSKKRTGREHPLPTAVTRQQAVDALLELLHVSREAAHIDPSRTLIQVDKELWTIVGTVTATPDESAALRRGGAKHKRVR
jgi:hypothetical protein